MRPSGRLDRVAAATFAARTRHSVAPRITALALLALIAACRGDTLTSPGRPAPTPPDLTLTGGVGTPIFPTVPGGSRQPYGVAVGLNNLGQVTGWAHELVPIEDDFKPYRWSSATGAVKLVGCCDSEWGNDINDAGVVVGVAQTDASRGNHAFVAAGTSMVTLPALPGGYPGSSTVAIAINNAGQIVGASPAAGNGQHAVLWSAAGVIQDLGTLGGTYADAIDINASAQVIGESWIAGDAATHFFLWSSGSGMQDLNTTIHSDITSVVEINDGGQIIGTYTTDGHSHAFLYTPGSGLRDLGTLGGATSAPTGLNSHGDVVGSSTLADGSTHVFLWTAADGMEDVTALTGVLEVRRLNDNLQTLTGTRPPSIFEAGSLRPRLVQLQVTQSNVPPTALFDAECNGLTCVLDATVSLDDKPGLTFAWDLGKFPGGSATGGQVTVTYPHAGQRTVTLTVTDAQGLTSSITKTLRLTDFPIASFTVDCVGLTCAFDASGTVTDNPAPLQFTWSFGDGGLAVAVAPTHTYAQAGTYSVSLEVVDYSIMPNRVAIITKQVTVGAPPQNHAPVAQFVASCTGTTCTFDATSSTDDGGIVSYTWDLNKFPGGSATGSIVTTTYPHNGLRSVTLTVTDAQGLSSSITKQIDVGAPPVDTPPVAKFTSSCTNRVCSFDASSSTDDVGIASFAWNVDKFPGGSATGVQVTTTYPHTGTRNVTLTVTDTKGQTSSVTHTITVQ